MRVALLTVFLTSAAAGPQGSTRYDAQTHMPRASSGCGKSSPYTAGSSKDYTATYAGTSWTYRVYVPRVYNKDTPTPVILQHPGWGMSASQEERGAGITDYAESRNFISITPQGANDNPNRWGPWYSWNAVGTTQSPGPAGATCTSKASDTSNCYTSCPSSCSRNSPQCWWTTCLEEITPSGTGYSPIGGFIPSLLDTLESQLCIDTSREYIAGESNGGMMAYQLGVTLSNRVAAIAPQFGSFHRGFNMAPKSGVPIMSIHGKSDTVVPANTSLSGDGYYYTTTSNIFNGDSYSSGWKKANGCSGSSTHYKTNYDRVKDLWCVSEGICSGGDVVRCSYTGGHNWFNGGGKDHGGLVVDFMMQWTKTSHIGRGYSEGETMGPGEILEDITAVDEDETEAIEDPSFQEGVLTQKAKAHYGNPKDGCLPDEDKVVSGIGHTCAPRIGTESDADSLPTPQCKLGGTHATKNGCPTDAQLVSKSKAWPICLAKGNTTDAYEQGDFHCLLVCPCQSGKTVNGECSAESHAHCPVGAKCVRGELRKRDQGVCTYPLSGSEATELVV